MIIRSSLQAASSRARRARVFQILRAYGRIAQPPRRERVPMERPEPLTYWQLDENDASTVPPDPDGKQQHVVEPINTHDVGTSLSRECPGA